MLFLLRSPQCCPQSPDSLILNVLKPDLVRTSHARLANQLPPRGHPARCKHGPPVCRLLDLPALLMAPSVLPFQSTGITTSTVSAGSVVRTRSLISIDGRGGRSVARAMEILAKDGAAAQEAEHTLHASIARAGRIAHVR
jgi:hypothetical protein